jgi:hypothetical protein
VAIQNSNQQEIDLNSGKYESRRRASPLAKKGDQCPIKGISVPPAYGLSLVTSLPSNHNTNPPTNSSNSLYANNPWHLSLDLVCLVDTSIDVISLDGLKGSLIFWLYMRDKRALSDSLNLKHSHALDSILANLWVAHSSHKQLVVGLRKKAITRHNPNEIGHRVKRNVLDFLTSKGFIKMYKGKPNQFEGLATWCGASRSLVRWFEIDSIRAQLAQNALFVELRKLEERKVTYTKSKYIGPGTYESVQATKTVKAWVETPIPIRDKVKARKLGKVVRGFNELWTNYYATLNDDPILPYCRRIFNGKLILGGRWYGSYQTLLKQERERILIDDMATLEPDFSGLHFNLLYANEGIQWVGDDVYEVDGYDREVIKRVCLPLMNTTSLRGLEGHITTSGKPNVKEAYQKHKAAMERYNKAKAKGAPWRKPQSTFEGFIEGIPDGTDGTELIAALMKKHEPIARRFGEKDLGLKTQYQDSQIMAAIIEELTKRHIPVLPVHDSVRCKVSDYSIVYDTMREQFKAATGFNIIVH